MMKYAFFFVFALCAVQGLQARSAQPEEREMRGIIDTIKEIIERIKNVIGNIGGNISEIIEQLKEKIQQIIGGIDIGSIVNEIKKKIEELIQMAGEAGRQCVEASRGDLEKLVTDAQEGVKNCAAEAEKQTVALQEQMDTLINKANAVKDDVTQRVIKCVDEHKLNPIAIFNCLKGQVAPVVDELKEIEEELKTTIAIAREVAAEAGATLATCVQKVQQETAAKEQEILGQIKDCITGAAA